MAGLLALFGRRQEGVPGPACVGGRLAGRVERLDVDAGMLLHQVEARAAAEQQRAPRHGDAQPFAFELAEILDRGIDRSVGCDDAFDDVVDGLERGVHLRRFPVGELHDVMAGPGRCFGRQGNQQLVGLAGDEVDLHVDFFLVRPFLDDRGLDFVGARDPVIPKPDRQGSGGVCAAHERRSDEADGSTSGHDLTTRQFFDSHDVRLPEGTLVHAKQRLLIDM